MSAIDRLVSNNEDYTERFVGPLPLVPALHAIVVTCMDSRIDVHDALGLREGEAHVIRNAGGVITDDVIRSVAISQRRMQTREVMVIHHTDCGMLLFTDEELKQELEDETGIRPTWDAQAFTDLRADVVRSMKRLRSSPFIPAKDVIRGFVFDVMTGRLDEVPAAG